MPLKPVCCRCSASSVVISMPAPASRTNEAAICVTANTRSRRLVPVVMRTPPLDSPNPLADSADGRRGTNASRTAAATARIDADPEQARIHGDVVGAHREAGRVAREHGHHRPRDGDGQHGAGAAQQQAFGQQRSTQRAGARAERRPDGKLTLRGGPSAPESGSPRWSRRR